MFGFLTHSTRTARSYASIQCRTYAAAPAKRGSAAAGGKKKGRPAPTATQVKYDTISRMLFPLVFGKGSENPNGVHRWDIHRALRRAVRSAEAHETIERAWQLHKRELRELRQEELRLKYESMKNALDKLQELDPQLYEIATARVDQKGILPDDAAELKTLKGPAKKLYQSRIQGLFPREMKIPVDTPRREGWDYAWKAPQSA
ncbi:hypothetical protein FRC02_008984 [Tulasnella sp. 418]|nr:hypothetical protein FRC02_008984 [Tulasnella sp. 418]